MVYYAGHGMEGNGRNWLIPVDAGLASDRDLPYEAINLDQVMEAIEGATLRMVVLDACRDFDGSDRRKAAADSCPCSSQSRRAQERRRRLPSDLDLVQRRDGALRHAGHHSGKHYTAIGVRIRVRS